jgi:DNA-binding LytR/AlgR family response regulator
MLRILIIDDEPLAQDVLETYVQKIPELFLIGKCNNAMDANKIMNEQPIDLIFLDIHMPHMSGMDFLKTLKNPPLVILTTAYPNFALESYDLNVHDYLLKPISFERFLKSINRLLGKEQKIVPDFFFVKADKKMIKINHEDINYVEGLKDYVIIRLHQSRVVTLQTMKSLEDKLPAEKFKRIHRSFIVNMNKIEAITGNVVEVREKGEIKQLPIGKNYKDDLLDMINENKL